VDDEQAILQGIKVLDVASYIAGPVATTIMADFGADVIKVEPPGGDPLRKLHGTPGLPQTSGVDFAWQVDNRNKQAISLDLSTEGGRDVLRRLVSDCDVFVTNFTRPARARLGLTYADLQPLNERLIYASLTAYGETGAEADKSGFDTTAYWARTGLMHLVRPSPDGPPARSLPGMGDHPSGVALFGAIMLALFERARTGRGRKVHSSLLANGLWSNAFYAQAALSGATVELRPARENWPNALTNHYRSRDGHWFILAVVDQDRQWHRLLAAIERPELADDPRFVDLAARAGHVTELTTLLDEVFAAKDWAEWRQVLDEHRLTFGNVAAPGDVHDDAQMVAAGALMPVDDSRIGSRYLIDSPLWVEGVRKRKPNPAPALGEHTETVLRAAGYDDDDLVRLRNEGAIPKA